MNPTKKKQMKYKLEIVFVHNKIDIFRIVQTNTSLKEKVFIV